ncbi:dihydroorotase [Flavobacterium sp.]|uniref:dihydroorotase n=1 Tax=Flavobacterium sp. TaxID=239 RepID=UPI002FDB82F6
MKTLVRNATVIDPNGPYHKEVKDLVITDSKLEEIGTHLPSRPGYTEIVLENLHVSPGWFDTSVSFGEPGYEERETLANGLDVAARSGFTAVAVQPNCFPVTDNQAQVRFLIEKAKNKATTLYPIGSLTQKSEGNDLAELYDMKNAGAIAFGDYGKSIANSNLLKIGLQYVQDFDGLVVCYSQDDQIKGQGVVHEGITAMQLGLKGIPDLAEEIAVARNLAILEYTGGKLHIPTLSSLKSVALIREAKQKGLQVTCSVAVAQLVLNETQLNRFETHYKLNPPLRDEATRIGLLNAVLDNTIDCITSDHNPIDIEHKKVEFNLAKSGSIGLESAFGALLTVLPLEVVVSKFLNGKTVFNLDNPVIAVNSPANLTLFNPDTHWIFGTEAILSKSKNAAFVNRPMRGKVYGIINNGQIII